MAGTTRVGFVGLGNIGKPMALRLAQADGIDLRVFDVAEQPLTELEAAGATIAANVAELGNWADVICVMVRDDAQVRSVLGEVLAELKPREDMVPVSFVVHSTVSPSTPAELQAEVTKVCGFAIEVVDAPVSGGPMGAADGSLAIMVGASDGAFKAVEPVLSRMGTKVIHAGEPGKGTEFKLARNLLHFVSFTAATEAARLAEAAGLDLRSLGDVVRHTDAITGGPGAILHRETTAPIAADDFWHGVFSHVVALGEKDLTFAVALADQLGVDVPLARLALDRLAPGLGLPRE
ncbi:NAD(P)-dependent oxidoreductase [Nocardioides sp. Kera G14]|uniref:NAD(P)-dependent oxidoreductase n=1 Tax=Nocardioides sp. Kera G14 TaxID=2884264 RepID=UPI001D117F45|nr:NAD(P)-dependent oxidoreductase [Nocardioides sp. Kera G14]UDY22232.1 NAD(P)-dependent oxidoreductase [Nocardioides sp. Kera G14]